jgi:hypothetical protein
MSAEKHVLGSDLRKIDRHVVQPHEYDEIPELTDDFLSEPNIIAAASSFSWVSEIV